MIIKGKALEELQKEYLSILKDFDGFCKENNLQYTLCFGTLLGAVRHKGFIPWDDDIDVAMHIDEIDKLINIWDKVGDTKKYFLQTKKTNYYITGLFPRMRKNGTTSVDPGFADMPIHWGFPLDIFPVINAPKTQFGKQKIKKFIIKARQVSNKSFIHKVNERTAKRLAYKTIKMIEKIKKISDKNKDSNELMIISSTTIKEVCKKDFYPLNKVLFEDNDFSCVNNYDAILKSLYKDYMVIPPIERQKHHEVEILDFKKDFTEYLKQKMIGEYGDNVL